MHPPSPSSFRALIPALLVCHVLVLAAAQNASNCPPHLPLFNSSVRVLGGRPAVRPAFDNIVTIAFEETRDANNVQLNYLCAGSLIHPFWVLTAAQCTVSATGFFVLHGASSLRGVRYPIAAVFPHRDFEPNTATPWRNDLMLLKLQNPILPISTTVQTPSLDAQHPQPSSIPSSTPPSTVDTIALRNVVRLNNNTLFGFSSRPTYLRLKGYGLSETPIGNEVSLSYETRPLHFVDLPTAPCPSPFGPDATRRICTLASDTCGPCFGDTGSPLYVTDKSATVAVLVAVATLNREAADVSNPYCITSRSPAMYTTIASAIPWMRSIVGDASLSEIFVPPNGISDVVLATREESNATFSPTSIIIVLTLVLAALLLALIVACVLHRIRIKRRRWQQGLDAESSFVNAGAIDRTVVDPFEGIQKQTESKGYSLSHISSSALDRLRKAKDLSVRSIDAMRALVSQEPPPILAPPGRCESDDLPEWISVAWAKLFAPPSKSDLASIHKVPTQRVVEDVLSGSERTIEPSLEDVAYAGARHDANIQAAWTRLALRTSSRNFSEGNSAKRRSPPRSPMPTLSPDSSRATELSALSHSGSGRPLFPRLRSPLKPLSSPLSPAPSGQRKADTLLFAFASIDAESEHVEESFVNQAEALQQLASLSEAKKHRRLDTLKRMFSRTHEEKKSVKNSAASRNALSMKSSSSNRFGVDPHQALSAREASSNQDGNLSNCSSSLDLDYTREIHTGSESSPGGSKKVVFEQPSTGRVRRYTGDRESSYSEMKSLPSPRRYRRSPSGSIINLKRAKSDDSTSENSDYSPDSSAASMQAQESNYQYETTSSGKEWKKQTNQLAAFESGGQGKASTHDHVIVTMERQDQCNTTNDSYREGFSSHPRPPPPLPSPPLPSPPLPSPPFQSMPIQLCQDEINSLPPRTPGIPNIEEVRPEGGLDAILESHSSAFRKVK